jgi:flotillin
VQDRLDGEGTGAVEGTGIRLADQTVIGKVGRVTGTIAPGQLGEIMISMRGGSEAFNAYAAETLEAAAGAERVRPEAAARSESTKLIGEAEAAATSAKGRAEGEAVRARGMAEAEAIKARADALAENQDAVIGQQLAEQWPAIVEAAAKPFGAVDQMIVLNGAQGLSEALAQALSQGVAGLQMARNLLAGGGGNGTRPTDDAAREGGAAERPAVNRQAPRP